MREMLMNHKAIDVSGCKKEGVFYILPSGMFAENLDYCNKETEQWIWSIGRRLSDNVILASHSTELYQNDLYECLWLR